MQSLPRRTFLKMLGTGAAGSSMILSTCSQFIGSQSPNIVFFMIDDLGWKDLGCMGSSYYETPHVDRLAAEGMRFTSAYACAPNCAPSRASFLTGMYTPRHGVYTVSSSARGESRYRKLIPVENTTVLDPRYITIAEMLQQKGYVSTSIGKWHLGDDPETGPTGQGFDVNVAGYHHGSPANGYFSPFKIPHLTEPEKRQYLTDRLTDEAVAFIESNRANPFFLYMTHYAVHTPLQAKEEMIEKYRQKPGSNGQNNPVYAAMVESMDQSIGRILETLDALQLTENTVVFFFSDNGGHGPATSMTPLRGSKGMLYEGGIRVPLIVRWPGIVQPGADCNVPVIGVDFFPTLLEMAGMKKPENQPVDGVSLLPLLKRETAYENRPLYWHFPAYLQADKRMKEHWRTTPAGAVRIGDWKLLEFFEDGRLELYNLKSDIGEQNNLALTMPEKRVELYSALMSWRSNVNAPVPTELNPEYKPD